MNDPVITISSPIKAGILQDMYCLSSVLLCKYYQTKGFNFTEMTLKYKNLLLCKDLHALLS